MIERIVVQIHQLYRSLLLSARYISREKDTERSYLTCMPSILSSLHSQGNCGLCKIINVGLLFWATCNVANLAITKKS
ncbi:hypothetical protein MYVALT_F_02440 [Candidatus Vallotia tarda]|uniref:Uncharacterized protein n=1 Tax=Candidatus Vallotiella hemipterorum TaxID=1177213 RepID=A0A916JTA7_9BURK|nr:hypothetical protein MYVALT_F_02440 [Candidatus Vallotia tarda]